MDYTNYLKYFREIFDRYQIGRFDENVFKRIVEKCIERFDGNTPMRISRNSVFRVMFDRQFIEELDRKYPRDSRSDDIGFHELAQEWFSKAALHKWKYTFVEYDKDNSESMEKNELESFLAFLGQFGEREQEIRKKLTECDTDGKEGISFEELEKFVRSEIKEILDTKMDEFIQKAVEDYRAVA
ncbi:uncharacterized protein LOC141909564 [Tubulanus polymorphus]|uniref:uncharacterized protein LOC141909564 n=1 Tax=Tubulanus polymorphus TaxID=672921 RepID=UPI003DA398C6